MHAVLMFQVSLVQGGGIIVQCNTRLERLHTYATIESCLTQQLMLKAAIIIVPAVQHAAAAAGTCCRLPDLRTQWR